VTKYIRYQSGAGGAYGILDGQTVREISGSPWLESRETGITHAAADVKLLYPGQPGKILAVGLNYGSHLGTRPRPTHPEMFYNR
jgi:hypothetical protein